MIQSKRQTEREGTETEFFPPLVYPHHLVLLQAALLHHLITLLLKRDDDECHKDVDEEEREDNKVDDIEDRHLHPVATAGTPVLLSHVNRVLQDPGGAKEDKTKNKI